MKLIKFPKTAVSLVGVCVALCLAAPSLMAQDTMIVRLSLRVSDFRFDTLNGYDFIKSSDNRVAYLMEPGKPMLPLFVPTYIIPFWKTVSYCEVVSRDSLQVPGFWRIYPAQDQADTSWVPPDSAVYYSDSLYPGIPTGAVDLASFDGAVLASPQANIFQYRPLSGKLFLYTEMTLKLVFKDSEPPVNAKQRYPHVQEIYDDMLREFVENDEAIGAWYRRPAMIGLGGKTTPPPVFAIITTENQMDEATQYADWTDRRGFPTIVVNVATILSSSPGRNPAEKVFNWIQTQYQAGISFVLFLGHEDEVPYRYLYCSDLYSKPDPPYSDAFIPSDLYFSSVSYAVTQECQGRPAWDCDLDQVYGEPGPLNGLPPGDAGSWDHYPEVFVGRVLAVNDPNEAENWFIKTLKYEKDPGNAGNLTKVKFISETDPCYRCEETKGHYPDRYHFTDLYNKPSREVLDTMSTKPCGWFNIYSHGEPTIFWTKSSPSDDSLLSVPDVPGQANLSELTNQDKYFLVYDIACFQAAFDSPDSFALPNCPPYRLSDTTIAEGFVEAYPLKGAAAFLGNTRVGHPQPGGSYDLHQAFLDFIFNPLGTPNRFLLGVPEAYSRAQANINPFVAREHNLFGSPVLDIWDTTAPRTIYVQHPSSIPSGQQNFTVRVLVSLKPLVPLRNAMVSVKGCNVYDFSATDINGYVTFSINPQGPGIMKVTATKHNHKPRESTCQVTGKGQLVTSESGKMPAELSLKTLCSGGWVRIAYAIPVEDEGLVSLKIYDVAGRETDNLLDAETQAGWYEQSWKPPASGAYILVLRTQNKTLTRKVVNPRR